MPKLKHKFYKTVNFFDLSLFCVCHGYKDNNGEAMKFPSPLDINQILTSVRGFSESYNEPLRTSSLYDAALDDEVEINVQPESVDKANEAAEEDEVHTVALYANAEGSDVVGTVGVINVVEEYSAESTVSEEVPSSGVDAVNDDADVEGDKPRRIYQSGRLDVYLQDIRDFGDYFVLLINSTNLNSSHSVTRDVASGVRKEDQLTVDQGADLSTHVIVYKKVIDGRQRCLVEKTTGLNTAVLKSFFDYLGKLVVEQDKKVFEIDDPDGKRDGKGVLKKRYVWPRFSFQGHPCESFFQDLENGYMSGISLVGGPKKIKGMDVNAPNDFQEVIIKVDANIGQLETAREKLGRLMQYGQSQDLDKLRVSFTDSSGTSHTREIDMQEPVGKDNLEYVKRRRIGMAFRPKSSYSQARLEFVRKMIEVSDE